MALRTAHGTARKYGKTEVFEPLPFDELPAGLPARYQPSSTDSARLADELAQLQDELAALPPDTPRGDVLKLRGAVGGKCKALNRALEAEQAEQVARMRIVADGLLPDIAVKDPNFVAVLPAALELFRSTCASLARDVGGGRIEDAEATMCESGALAFAASKVCWASNNLKDAGAMAELSAKMFGLAHEYAAKRARIRGENTPTLANGLGAVEAARLVREAFGEHARPRGEMDSGEMIEMPPPEQRAPEPQDPVVSEPVHATPTTAPPLPVAPSDAAPGSWEINQSRRFYREGGFHGIGAGDPRFLVSAADRAKHETKRFADDLADAVQEAIDSGNLPKI